MSQVQSLPTRPMMLPVASHRLDDRPAPMLIRVPAARATRPARRPSARAMARVAAGLDARPRRRLRREVRLAGSLLAVLAPMALAAVLLSAGSATPIGDAAPGFAATRPPVVRLSIEAPPPETPIRSAVILPGYLLPDDGTASEEPPHAGG